jgi:hypothetical protein
MLFPTGSAGKAVAGTVTALNINAKHTTTNHRRMQHRGDGWI